MKRGGRKHFVCVCARVCVTHVSCLELTASPPCVKSFPVVVWSCSWSVLSILVCSVLEHFLSLSGFGSLSWVFLHLCCWSGSDWSFWLCFWVCPQDVFVLCQLAFSVLYGISDLFCSVLTLLMVPPFTGDQRCGLRWTSKHTFNPHDSDLTQVPNDSS